MKKLEKIKSENEKNITDAINKCVAFFGQPVAVVCDLSSNIMNAVKAVLKNTPLLICHYHFLENGALIEQCNDKLAPKGVSHSSLAFQR